MEMRNLRIKGNTFYQSEDKGKGGVKDENGEYFIGVIYNLL